MTCAYALSKQTCQAACLLCIVKKHSFQVKTANRVPNLSCLPHMRNYETFAFPQACRKAAEKEMRTEATKQKTLTRVECGNSASILCCNMDVSKNRGTQNGWSIMKNPIKMDDLEVPLFFWKHTPMLTSNTRFQPLM